MNEFENNPAQEDRKPTLPDILQDLKKLLKWKIMVKNKVDKKTGKIEEGLSTTSKIAGMAEVQLLKDINKLDAETRKMLLLIIGRIYSYLQNMENTIEDSPYALGEMMDDLIRLSKWEIIIKKKEITGEEGIVETRRIAKQEETLLVENMKRLDPDAKDILNTMIGKIYNSLQPTKEHDER